MKMTMVAILAVVSMSVTAQAQALSGIHCAGKTLPPGSCADPDVCNSSNSFFYFTIDDRTGEPGPAGFRFHLYNGTGKVNPWELPGANVTPLEINTRRSPAPGQAGELKIKAGMLDNFETVKLDIAYDGDDFSGRIPSTAVTKIQKEQALMNIYLSLVQTGFNHVSYDPLVPPSQLGGSVLGFAPWKGFQKTIDFRNIICARY